MPTDDEIREICSRLLTAKDSDFESVVQELRSALRNRFEKLSNLAVATILKMPGFKKSDEETMEIGDLEMPGTEPGP